MTEGFLRISHRKQASWCEFTPPAVVQMQPLGASKSAKRGYPYSFPDPTSIYKFRGSAGDKLLHDITERPNAMIRPTDVGSCCLSTLAPRLSLQGHLENLHSCTE